MGFGLFQQLRYNLSLHFTPGLQCAVCILRFTLTVVSRLEKTVSVDPLSSRGINKFHLEGDFHLESDIEAIKSIPMFIKAIAKFCKLSHQSHMNQT